MIANVKPGALIGRVYKKTEENTRDLKVENENLRKELDRKSTRNDILAKELYALRIAHANQQRELRLISGLFEKSNGERQSLSSEVIRLKERNDKQDQQLARLGSSQILATHIDKLQNQVESTRAELAENRNTLGARNERITALERELEILHRSIDAQMQYESSGISGGSSNREMMRSLYYELGKRQTDAHSLALALTDSDKKVELMEEQLKQIVEINEDLRTEMKKMEEHGVVLTQQTVRDSNESAALRERIAQQTDQLTKAHQQIEDISKRLSETRSKSESDSREAEARLSSLQVELSTSQREAVSQAARVEALQQSIAHMENVNQLMEQRVKAEWDKLIAEKTQLRERVEQSETVQAQADLLRKGLADALSGRDDAQRGAAAAAVQVENVQRDLGNQLAEVQSRAEHAERSWRDTAALLGETEGERDEAIAALRQTLAAAKEVSTRLKQEIALRVAAEERASLAEKLADGLRKSKSQVSTAVLDALHKERSKNAALEKALSQVPVASRFEQLLHEEAAKRHEERQQPLSRPHQDRPQQQHGHGHYVAAAPHDSQPDEPIEVRRPMQPRQHDKTYSSSQSTPPVLHSSHQSTVLRDHSRPTGPTAELHPIPDLGDGRGPVGISQLSATPAAVESGLLSPSSSMGSPSPHFHQHHYPHQQQQQQQYPHQQQQQQQQQQHPHHQQQQQQQQYPAGQDVHPWEQQNRYTHSAPGVSFDPSRLPSAAVGNELFPSHSVRLSEGNPVVATQQASESAESLWQGLTADLLVSHGRPSHGSRGAHRAGVVSTADRQREADADEGKSSTSDGVTIRLQDLATGSPNIHELLNQLEGAGYSPVESSHYAVTSRTAAVLGHGYGAEIASVSLVHGETTEVPSQLKFKGNQAMPVRTSESDAIGAAAITERPDRVMQSPSGVVAAELRKLRDELRRIEDTAPSPLSHSLSQSLAGANSGSVRGVLPNFGGFNTGNSHPLAGGLFDRLRHISENGAAGVRAVGEGHAVHSRSDSDDNDEEISGGVLASSATTDVGEDDNKRGGGDDGRETKVNPAPSPETARYGQYVQWLGQQQQQRGNEPHPPSSSAAKAAIEREFGDQVVNHSEAPGINEATSGSTASTHALTAQSLVGGRAVAPDGHLSQLQQRQDYQPAVSRLAMTPSLHDRAHAHPHAYSEDRASPLGLSSPSTGSPSSSPHPSVFSASNIHPSSSRTTSNQDTHLVARGGDNRSDSYDNDGYNGFESYDGRLNEPVDDPAALLSHQISTSAAVTGSSYSPSSSFSSREEGKARDDDSLSSPGPSEADSLVSDEY